MFVEGYNVLGNLHKDCLLDPIEAEKFYNKAIQIKPDYTEAIQNLGVMDLPNFSECI
jgi:hypothetical protein